MKHIYWHNKNKKWYILKGIDKSISLFRGYGTREEAEERVKELRR